MHTLLYVEYDVEWKHNYQEETTANEYHGLMYVFSLDYTLCNRTLQMGFQ